MPKNTQQTALERLETEYAAKRADIERAMALAARLPTHGLVFRWIGDGGYIGNDKQPDKEKTAPLDPYIFHSPFRDAQHVAYKAPDEYPTYSALARKMERHYVLALCEAYKGRLIDILALKGTYASNVHSKWNWQESRDYKDAAIVAVGRCEVQIDASVEHSGSAKLGFYVDLGTPEAPEVVRVSAQVPYTHRLAPRPDNIQRYGNHGPVARVGGWTVPENRAVKVWKRGHYNSTNKSCTLEYLYDSVDAALTDLFAE